MKKLDACIATALVTFSITAFLFSIAGNADGENALYNIGCVAACKDRGATTIPSTNKQYCACTKGPVMQRSLKRIYK